MSDDEKCFEIIGELEDADEFLAYDSKGHERSIALCGVHADPRNPRWQIRWPCPYAELAWTRSKTSKTIHLSGCYHENNSLVLATSKSLIELMGDLDSDVDNRRFCKDCIPTANEAADIIYDSLESDL